MRARVWICTEYFRTNHMLELVSAFTHKRVSREHYLLSLKSLLLSIWKRDYNKKKWPFKVVELHVSNGYTNIVKKNYSYACVGGHINTGVYRRKKRIQTHRWTCTSKIRHILDFINWSWSILSAVSEMRIDSWSLERYPFVRGNQFIRSKKGLTLKTLAATGFTRRLIFLYQLKLIKIKHPTKS